MLHSCVLQEVNIVYTPGPDITARMGFLVIVWTYQGIRWFVRKVCSPAFEKFCDIIAA